MMQVPSTERFRSANPRNPDCTFDEKEILLHCEFSKRKNDIPLSVASARKRLSD